ncbi:putative dihydropterin pyrophosphokinase/dihydropteroate synthase [Coccomyxa subellipsoidea C-169]|uniref:Dihydropterin pyrophosphokinase/dihydropteroate synthase n=1 Tax=Coccomyxa subellipsoidea (strain C-169) TaxID=574566 RepID=I0Z1Z9_COCSC|nr:putative dihydropterin pyrophosphokinase/dihydropteroate synthase [Coccomyxa subellipsoidea C-169]EIE24668.1 putative dihydropterin pyrophosphokinase/dihydropteroate synthase [Coccomyxa subellipsoidea C-169]|eukprot:XP_005649212.1 putative dihydropterin pyrophosphokinase/dihydropteroate synthase [Coccomyxa subellipsoidea C-169]
MGFLNFAEQGDRVSNIQEALKLLPAHDIEVVRHSRLYESAPAYVTDQPRFINAAVAVTTSLEPRQLLHALKKVEAELGREAGGLRWGPRPLDLDIIFYDSISCDEDGLQVPHPRWQERSFVQAPVADLYAASELGADSAAGQMAPPLQQVHSMWAQAGGESSLGGADLGCVLPLPRLGTWAWQGRSQVMGILNVTPDSFSDGGQLPNVEAALAAARQMVAAGADMLDIGGQSTRPGADRLPAEVELQRVLPVIRALAEDEALQGVPLSIDTFYAEVAREAVAAGAHIVNDVSGGSLDPAMHKEVARLGVPYILMHMRGDPGTMASREHTMYADVCADVGRALQSSAEAATSSGIEPWRIILDPGIGFAKTAEGNFQLIGGLDKVRAQLKGPLHNAPVLVGPSRKSFLGKITGRDQAKDRDIASAAAAALCVSRGANIVRAHNVAAVRDAVRVADAVVRSSEGVNL